MPLTTGLVGAVHAAVNSPDPEVSTRLDGAAGS